MISESDREILRRTAARQMEIATSPLMQGLEKLWLDHNACRPSRPTIAVEWGTFERETIPPLLQCEDDEAREVEYALYANFVGQLLFEDDSFVPDYMPVRQSVRFVPFGIPVKREMASDNSVGHHFYEYLVDLEEDFHKLGKSTWSVNTETTERKMELYDSLFGDILPVKLVGASQVCSLTQDIVHIMSMENMFCSMYDYPDLFKQMLDMLSRDYVEYFHWREDNGLILPTVRSEWLGQGSYCFTDDLPGYDELAKRKLTTKDVWAYMDSQETTGVSPDMYHEFVFPYYERVSALFGKLSYGCCEATDPVWEKSLSTLPNLRKVSISPWCNEEFMGERLRGTNIVYLRKPTPNILGTHLLLDEDAVRKVTRKTLNAAKGCTIEFAQRDVYTVHHNPGKVKRYVAIMRECFTEAGY